MQLETQKLRDQAHELAVPIGKAVLVVRKSAKSGLDQAMDASQDLQRQFKRLMDRREQIGKAARGAGKSAKAGLDQAIDGSQDLQRELKYLIDRRERVGKAAIIAGKSARSKSSFTTSDAMPARPSTPGTVTP